MQKSKRRIERKPVLVASSVDIPLGPSGIYVFIRNPKVQPKPAPQHYKPSKEYLQRRQEVLQPVKAKNRNFVGNFDYHRIKAGQLINSLLGIKQKTKQPVRIIQWQETKLG